MIQTIPLFPGVTLQCFCDHRFKHSCLSLQLIRPMCREEAAMNALLPAVLLRGTRQYPDLRAITLRLDDLYGAAVGALVRRVGDYHTTGLCCSFIEDDYALQGDAILAPMLAFLGQILLDPLLEDGAFPTDFVESEKRNLIATIESQRNDKRAYASNQMFRAMCKSDSFGIPRLGEIEQVRAITPQSLYDHYRNILKTSPVQLFYVGSVQPETLAALLQPMLQSLGQQAMDLPPQLPFQDGGSNDITEKMDVAQGKLCMGFVTPVTLRTQGFAAMQVFNALFGAGMTSKLFMQIREAMSLCYDIGSGFHGSKGILTVYAGIDSGHDTLVKEQILLQLEACRAGDITDEELVAAKQALLTQLQATHDSPSAIEGYYATAALSGLNMTPAEYMQAVHAVTKADVAQAAQSLRLHTVYFLKGDR